MISTLAFKKKYPRLYKKIIKFYGRDNIHDVQAAIQMYLRGDALPKCDICGTTVLITKKFREPVSKVRCYSHINTDNIISLADIMKLENDHYKIDYLPDKFLTPTDQIRVKCKHHGIYTVNLGNFINGMKCQLCYHESRIGSQRGAHSEETKLRLSIAKTGKTLNFTAEAKKKKSDNQKLSWARRREDTLTYNLYLENLSNRRKEYLENNDFVFPKKEKTKLELAFENFLNTNGITFTTQYILGGKKFDFYIPDMLLLVEVDGEYWHRLPSSIKNDIEKHKICKDHNIQLVRISSDNFIPEIIFENFEIQNEHTEQILRKRGISEF